MSQYNHLHAVILAGGSGTRLWPLSTQQNPKQFLSVGSKQSFLSQTAARLKSFIADENLWISCGKKHAASMSQHIPGLKSKNILIEPMAKNTAPALALAAFRLQALDPEAVMIVLPADHLILPKDWEFFANDLKIAAQLAQEKKALVTLGIKPEYAATGFGYLESGESIILEEQPCLRVKAFHEKPDLKTAETYLQKGQYFWNSGMFVWQAKVFLEELERLQPKMWQAFQPLFNNFKRQEDDDQLKQIFTQLESISVDYAIMEKAKNVWMVSANFSWDDVGSLEALNKVLSKDEADNFFAGEMIALDSKNNLVISQAQPVSLVGVQNMVVINTPQATLVIPRKKVQHVKAMVEYLKKIGKEDLI